MLSPYLGNPWVATARHLLAGEVEDDENTPGGNHTAASLFKNKKGKGDDEDGTPLPTPRLPPNGTHTQL